MFQPESEDLLPRSAPKPSASVATMNCAKPTVPEVSILFNQDLPLAQSQTQSKQMQLNKPGTYAAWKKQCLPNVAFSYQQDNKITENPIQVQRSPLYPMRIHTQSANPLPAGGSNVNMTSVAGNDPSDLYSRYHQSPDNNEVFSIRNNNNNATVGSTIPTKPSTPPIISNHHGHNSPNFYINKQDSVVPIINSTNEVLTICAGTQTNNISTNEPISTYNLATKDDINDIMKYLKEIRVEQIQLLQTMHQICLQNKPIILKDSATQCELMTTTAPRLEVSPLKKIPIIYDYIAEESADEKTYRESRFNVYNNTVANSTNDPSTVSSPASQQYPHRNNYAMTPRSNVLPVLPKPNTEKSMVMNELALKYLPSDKLSDLLQEIRLSESNLNPPSSPLCENDNNEKGPSDMSNASYKYLKKYRLLPEENNNKQHNQHAQYNKNQMYNQQDVLIGDLEAIKRHPKFL